MNNNKLFVSVDMDEWYFTRWATGSAHSLWPDLESCFKAIYGSEAPPKQLYTPTNKILELFDQLNFKSTFFFTGYIANIYPDLVKTIADQGHEIGCHNYYHLDYEYEPNEKFKTDLAASKKLLENISGQEVIGYRSPNSSIPKNLVNDLTDLGFKYDSSVTPTRRFMGKFGKFINAPQRPYNPHPNDIGKEGNAKLWEFPWAVFPFMQLPAGSGIMHRIGGDHYNRIATANSLSKGHTCYYFHPYELASLEEISDINLPLKVKIFLRNIGDNYFQSLKRFLKKNKDHLINGTDLHNLVN